MKFRLKRGEEKPVHMVATSHIQDLINNGALLARAAHGKRSDTFWGAPAGTTLAPAQVNASAALDKAAHDLRHAADELQAEADSCRGWRQV